MEPAASSLDPDPIGRPHSERSIDDRPPKPAIFFSEAQTPLLLDREVARRSRRSPRIRVDLSLHALLDHLRFTIALEGHVSDACGRLAGGHLKWLDPEQRDVAVRIADEELDHSAGAQELIARLLEMHPVPVCPDAPRFAPELAALLAAAADDGEADLVALEFVCVSETLITGTLRTAKRDDRIFGPVRRYLADHARDEAFHRVYFSNVFRGLWLELTPDERRRLGILVPRMLSLYLEPDIRAWAWALETIGFTDGAERASAVAGHPFVRQSIRASAVSTVRLVEQLGLLRDPTISDRFVAHQLI